MTDNDYKRFINLMADSNRISDLQSGDVLISRGRYNKKGTEIIFGKYANGGVDYFYNHDGSCVHVTNDFDKKLIKTEV